MTRIIAGTLGGRGLRTPAGSGTRPTSERVREALFSALEARDAVRGARVLDLYAGSGALGLEAASRGAASVVLVESDRRAAAVAAANVRALGVGALARVRTGTVAAVLAPDPGPDDAAHLVLLDPPYDLAEAALRVVLDRLAAGWLAPGGLLVLERSSRSPEPAWPSALVGEGRPRRYGETTLWFAERAPARTAVGGVRHPRRSGAPLWQAGAMTDVSIPRPTDGDVVERILQDHRLFEDLLREARRSDADRAAARAALAEVLVAHATAEEEEVYPTLRQARAIDEHEEEHGEEEHAEINAALLALLRVDDTDSERYDEALEDLATAVNHHTNEEEQTILNPAREEVSIDRREALGTTWLTRRNLLLEEGCAAPEQVAALVEQDRARGLLDEGED